MARGVPRSTVCSRSSARSGSAQGEAKTRPARLARGISYCEPRVQPAPWLSASGGLWVLLYRGPHRGPPVVYACHKSASTHHHQPDIPPANGIRKAIAVHPSHVARIQLLRSNVLISNPSSR